MTEVVRPKDGFEAAGKAGGGGHGVGQPYFRCLGGAGTEIEISKVAGAAVSETEVDSIVEFGAVEGDGFEMTVHFREFGEGSPAGEMFVIEFGEGVDEVFAFVFIVPQGAGVELFDAELDEVEGTEAVHEKCIDLREGFILLALEGIDDAGNGAARYGGEHADILQQGFALIVHAIKVGHRSQVKARGTIAAAAAAEGDLFKGCGRNPGVVHGTCVCPRKVVNYVLSLRMNSPLVSHEIPKEVRAIVSRIRVGWR